jgi:MSHA pilin protein MshC
MQGAFTKGFTLIELIATLVLLSILGVVAFARLGNLDQFESQGFYRDTLTAVRYAQKLAVSTGCRVDVTLENVASGTQGRYSLHQGQLGCTDTTYTRDVLNPADRTLAYQGTAPSGVTISPTASFRFTPQSTVEGLASDTTFSIGGSSFTVYLLSGLVDAP